MLSDSLVQEIVAHALAEDVGPGDITTLATVKETATAQAEVIAKAEGVIAGLAVMEATFRALDKQVQFVALVPDGSRVAPRDVVARITGSARALLTAERTALNFLQRMSGIATLTARYVAAVEGTKVQILDTRKTTPGLRVLDKYAVRMGGGGNHRFGLFDGVLIKDNHLRAAGSITAAVSGARAAAHHLLKIEVEVTTLAELQEALAAGAEAILLDNMSPSEVAEAVKEIAGRALAEASGEMTPENVWPYAEAGVDFISAGALTHSAPALNFSLEFAG